jgi:hypothetical protein
MEIMREIRRQAATSRFLQPRSCPPRGRERWHSKWGSRQGPVALARAVAQVAPARAIVPQVEL